MDKQEAVLCQKCGTINSGSRDRCINCGASLKPTIITAKIKKHHSSSPILMMGIVAAAVVLVLAVSIIVGIYNQNAPVSTTVKSSKVAFSSAHLISTVADAISSSSNDTASKKPKPSRSIKGSSVTTIKLSLEKWGLKAKVSSSDQGDGYFYTATATDSDTGAQLHYNIVASGDLSVEGATFSVTNLAVIKNSAFTAICKGFLGYCATMPYSKDSPAKAKKWVETHMSAATHLGKPASITIGDAKFSLSGNKALSRELTIEKVK